MRSKDAISSIILLIISILTCFGSSRLDIGNINNPGSGFFPLFLGMVIGFLALSMMMKTVLAKPVSTIRDKLSGDGNERKKKVLYLVLALASYGLVLERLGYTLTTILLFIFILKGISSQKWYVAVVGSLFASLGSYIIFHLALKIQLPAGFAGM